MVHQAKVLLMAAGKFLGQALIIANDYSTSNEFNSLPAPLTMRNGPPQWALLRPIWMPSSYNSRLPPSRSRLQLSPQARLSPTPPTPLLLSLLSVSLAWSCSAELPSFSVLLVVDRVTWPKIVIRETGKGCFRQGRGIHSHSKSPPYGCCRCTAEYINSAWVGWRS